jgi:hypothetical protein
MSTTSHLPEGIHTLLDYHGVQIENLQEISAWTLSAIQKAMLANNIPCIFNHVEVFEESNDPECPQGFTVICKSDVGHASAYYYTGIQFLAIDLFGEPARTFPASADMHRKVMDQFSCKFLGRITHRADIR